MPTGRASSRKGARRLGDAIPSVTISILALFGLPCFSVHAEPCAHSRVTSGRYPTLPWFIPADAVATGIPPDMYRISPRD